jgi:hypothetical protein
MKEKRKEEGRNVGRGKEIVGSLDIAESIYKDVHM